LEWAKRRRLCGRKEAINLLRQHQAEIAAHGVRALYLFGSTRRDEARPDSDVDLFIDYAERFSLLDLVALQDELDPVLGTRADLTTRGGLHPRLCDDILREAEQVF
jgi:predicted nucleotidyltransferase